MLSGILIVAVITLVAGFVAYIGDRVGHQVGRRRLTLFGLRPKYTSTIVAVGTGMVIALTVTVAALIGSQLVRTAFFQLGSLNSQISALQAQATSLQNDVTNLRNGTLVLPRGQAISGVTIFLSRDQSSDEQLRLITRFFEQTVRLGDEQWTPAGLKPFPQKVTDPAIVAKLRQELAIVNEKNAAAPVMLMAVADQNLFRGEELHFALEQWVDIRLAKRGEVLASLDVTGGQPANLQLAALEALREMAKRGMPPPFLSVPYVNVDEAKSLQAALQRDKGHYRVQVKAATDTYPRTGGVALEFSLVPVRS